MLQAPLLGGLFIGILSALPVISWGNCCCLWVVSGGVLAAYSTPGFDPNLVEESFGKIEQITAYCAPAAPLLNRATHGLYVPGSVFKIVTATGALEEGVELNVLGLSFAVSRHAWDLGLRVVAEGVEDEATLMRLKELNCDFAQGNVIGTPMPLETFDAWRQQKRSGNL